MLPVTMNGDTPLAIVILEQQRIICVDPGAPFIGRTVHKKVFIDYENIFPSNFGIPSPARGADIHTVALQLGHRDLRMAARYQYLAPDYLQQAVRGLDAVFKPELMESAGSGSGKLVPTLPVGDTDTIPIEAINRA